eukprot:TRINITY_DN2570_c0_g1_i1.p1 TRINITY_DN2570_c0_g1~~TRINITY_DN2570_c0_g1_i1.p1  ORF type:complete len:116 (+),score=49.29 TRINITY_DN2570_c0_g1_i1:258-605(+)
MQKAANSVMAVNKLGKNSECVKVVVRCRPMNSKEKQQECGRIVEMDPTLGQVAVQNPKADADETPKTFTLDAVYDWDSPVSYTHLRAHETPEHLVCRLLLEKKKKKKSKKIKTAS